MDFYVGSIPTHKTKKITNKTNKNKIMTAANNKVLLKTKYSKDALTKRGSKTIKNTDPFGKKYKITIRF